MDFIRICIADTTHQPWIGQDSFQRVVFSAEYAPKSRFIRVQHFRSAGVMVDKHLFAPNQMECGPFFLAGFRENQCVVRKEEGCEGDFTRRPRTLSLPLKSPCDHQVEDEEQIIRKTNDDTLAETCHITHLLAPRLFDRRLNGTGHKGAHNPNALDNVSDDALSQCIDIHDDIR